MSPRKKDVSSVAEPLLLDVGAGDHPVVGRRSRLPFKAATVSLDPGVSLVEASAGTGKTFSITLLVLRLLLSRRADGEYRVRGIGNILVVTFTHAATDELITRVRTVLRDAVDVFSGACEKTGKNTPLFQLREDFGGAALPRLREALASLDQLSVFTIHGFCKRVLDENALESGTPFDARFLEDDALLVERMAEDWWRRTMYEDTELATLAVSAELTYATFIPDLKKWQRLPETRIEPSLGLSAARGALNAAIGTLGRTWNADRVQSFLAERKWLASSPLSGDASHAEVLRAGERLEQRDLAAATLLATWCASRAMLDAKTGMYKKPAAMRDAVHGEPFVQGCDAIAAALGALYQSLRVDFMQDVQQRFDDEKRRRHILGFDDLLRRLKAALEKGGAEGHLARAIRAHYDAALIDEFQDTDPFQFPIFSRAFTGRPLFLIGDPKQAIYGFRGADLFAYLDAAEQAQREYGLSRNWRSTTRMVGAVNALFEHRPAPFLYPQIDFDPAVAADQALEDPLGGDGVGALHWWVLPPEEGKKELCQLSKGAAAGRVEQALAHEVVRLLSPSRERHALAPKQVAVLVRTTREGLAAQRALRALRVPCIVSGLDDILCSREMGEVELVMHAVLTPGHAPVVRAALATELWGLDAAGIHALTLAEDEAAWQAIVESLRESREQWLRHGFMRMVQRFLARVHAWERLLAFDDGDRRLTNLRHAIELLHSATSEEGLSPEGLLLWISRTRADKSEKKERVELRLESDDDAVQISTIHKAKGLEYDVVICPGLWATRRDKADEPVLVHEGQQQKSIVFDHGSERRAERGRLATAEALAEDLRILYVALTRARFRCYVAWGAVTNRKTKLHSGHTALGYLLRPGSLGGTPEDLAERVPEEYCEALPAFESRLAELVAKSGGAMTMETIPEERTLTAWTGGAKTFTAPVQRTTVPAEAALRTWRVASFTSLSAGRHVDDARDVTDRALDRASEPGERPELPPTDFLAFPAGRMPGIALHELFERAAFDATALELETLAGDVLGDAHLAEPAERIGAVTRMAEQVLRTPLPAAGFALRDVPRSRTLREWAFHLPLGVVNGERLASIFTTHGEELGRRYAPALRGLSAERSHGFLTGVVDLALQHDGRWFVVDWKSNHLGVDPVSYERAALEQEMVGSHYILQYHLYITALHRFLRTRQPGYDYDAHIGGAWYGFLRGIDGTGRGWFHDRPPRALVDALSAMMDEVVP